MEELVLNNVNLIYLVLKKYKLYEVRDDYFDIGMIGLVKAAKTYSEDIGFTFSTYAVKCIEHEVWGTRRKNFTLKRGMGQQDISLNTTLNTDDDNLELLDLIPDKFNLENHIIQNDLYERLYKEINNLPERNKIIICSMFELENYKKLTQQELAKKLNISQAQVSRCLKKTIKILHDKFGGEINGC